jgi:hypothetical protein
MNNLFRQLLRGIDSYNLDQQNILKLFGNIYIKEITIYRKPISSLIKQSLNTLSNGQFLKNLKNSPYDDVYHLFIVITLEDNNKFIVEKNERINIEKLNDIEYFNLTNNKIQKQNILINEKIKFIDLLNNTYNLMGKNYFIYDSGSYNCQNYILNILKANHLNNNDYENFIYQNPIYLYHNLDNLNRVSKIITDIAAKINLLKVGSGIVNKVYHDNIKYSFNKLKENKNRNIQLIPDEGLFIVYYYLFFINIIYYYIIYIKCLILMILIMIKLAQIKKKF